jgi:fructosamine-3-kinase
LTIEDRRGIERFCARLRDRIPPQPPSLLHGDLFCGNILIGAEGEPVLIDPAVHYGWAESELAIATLDEPFPETFFAAYTACRPLEAGWRERFPLYLLKERLYMLSQVGNRFGDVGRIRGLIARHG